MLAKAVASARTPNELVPSVVDDLRRHSHQPVFCLAADLEVLAQRGETSVEKSRIRVVLDERCALLDPRAPPNDRADHKRDDHREDPEII